MRFGGFGFNKQFAFGASKAGRATLGPELITNGDCSSATGWNNLSAVGTWSVSGGTMNATANDLLVSNNGTESGIVEGHTYRVSYTIASVTSAGSVGVGVRIGLSQGALNTTVGTYTEDLLADSIGDEGGWRFATGGTVISMTFDNFSCREVLP